MLTSTMRAVLEKSYIFLIALWFFFGGGVYTARIFMFIMGEGFIIGISRYIRACVESGQIFNSCGLFQGQEDVSYLTHSMQSQSSVPFAASPSYFQGTTKNFCWSALSTETCGFSEEAKCTCGVRGDRHKCFFPQCSNS